MTSNGPVSTPRAADRAAALRTQCQHELDRLACAIRGDDRAPVSWGQVGDLQDVLSQLRTLADRLHRTGEYAA